MNDNHIIEILEQTSFANISEVDRATIQAHTADCVDCAHAYRAAMVSGSLLKERASEVTEPPPFFHTRVLAALRERQAVPSFLRFWRSAGALASSMAATVALLAVLSFLVPGTQQSDASAFNAYSAEEVILNQGAAQEQVSDAQVLTTLYDEEEDAR